MRVPWRHIERSSAGLLGSLHGTRNLGLLTEPTFYKPLSAKRPCVNPVSLVWYAMHERRSRARFVRGAAPSCTAARGPSGCWSRSNVRSATLASSQRRRNSSRCEHHDLPHCLEPLSSRLLFHGNHSPPENVHRNNFSKRIIHSSILTAPLSPPPQQCL